MNQLQDTNTYLLTIESATDVKSVGGKASSLARLAKKGAPGSPAVVLTIAAFRRHLRQAQVEDEVQALLQSLHGGEPSDWQTRASAIREAIARTPVSSELLDQFYAQGLAWAEAPLAVRSSAVGEDSAGNSFAGQFDSVLGVQGRAHLDTAIRQVWASMYSEHCLQYAKHKGVLVQDMAVVVQRLFQPKWAGVLFSVDPLDRDSPCMRVEYCAGLGERLVSGSTTPGYMLVRRDGFSRVEAGEGDEGAMPSHDLKALSRLFEWALVLEAQEGPQDIEWAIDEFGAVCVLQARPITQFAPKPAPVRQWLWSNANVAENFPNPLTPLLYSVVKKGYSAYFTNLGKGFGIPTARLEEAREALDNIVGCHAGRLYYNLSSIHSVLHLMPSGPWLAAAFNDFTGAQSLAEDLPAPLSKADNYKLLLRVGSAVLHKYSAIESRARQFENQAVSFAARYHPDKLRELDRYALTGALRDFLDIRLNRWNNAALADTAAMACYAGLKHFLAKHDPLKDAGKSEHNNLLRGLPGLISSEPVNRLWSLAEQVKRSETLYQTFSTTSPETVLARFSTAPAGTVEHAFWRDFLQYLDAWGFRSSQELTLIAPTPHEDPLPTMRVLHMYVVKGDRSPQSLSEEQADLRRQATRALEQRLSGRASGVPLFSKAGRFRLLLKATQGAIGLRERVRFKQALLYTRLRQICLALGAKLVSDQILAVPEDVFFLTMDELISLASDDVLYPDTLPNLISNRRVAFEEAHGLQPPDTFTLAYGQHWRPGMLVSGDSDSAVGSEEGELKGASACGGRVRGRAAVICDVKDANQIQAGDLLVTRQTDPGWASVFFMVKGLVIERGGMLSHGAIIAREYGIPAVVGVQGATQKIKHHSEIEINGDRGVVRT